MFPSYSKPLYLLMIFPWFFQLLGSSLPLVALRHRAASRACRSVRTRSKVTFFALSGAGFFIPSSGIITWGIPSEAPKTSKNGQFLGWFSQFFGLMVVYFGGLARFDGLRKSIFLDVVDCWCYLFFWNKEFEPSFDANPLRFPLFWRAHDGRNHSKGANCDARWYITIVNSPRCSCCSSCSPSVLQLKLQMLHISFRYEIRNLETWCALEFGWSMRLAMLEKQTASFGPWESFSITFSLFLHLVKWESIPTNSADYRVPLALEWDLSMTGSTELFWKNERNQKPCFSTRK